MALLVQHPIRLDESVGEPQKGGLQRCVGLWLLGYRLRPIKRFVVLAAFALLVVACRPAQAQAPAFKENAIKAVFLFNFTQFVEWPPQAFSAPRSPLVIGVLGKDPFGRLLDEAVNGEVAGGHRLVVERYRRVEEIQTCHVLFISRSEADRLDQILANLKYRKILTVTDVESAARSGVMIRFVTQQNKIRLRINSEAAKAAYLTISSKLLRLGGTADGG